MSERARTLTIAITGASGFIGGRLSQFLVERGHRVRAFSRRPIALASTDVEWRPMDLPDAIPSDAFDGADAVVHAAYATRETDADAARRVNEDGTLKVVEAARRAGAHLTFLSSFSASDESVSEYGRSKRAWEKRLEAGAFVARLGLVVGAGSNGLFQRLVAAIRLSPIVPLPDGGRQPLQTIFIGDACAALARGIEEKRTGLYRLATPEAVTLSDVAHSAAAALRLRRWWLPVPVAPLMTTLSALERRGLRFGFRSDNVAGLLTLRHEETAADWAKLGLTPLTMDAAVRAALQRPAA